MAQVTVTINSRDYAIACDAGEELHIIQLARILDEKAKLLTSGGATINENMLLAMVGLLLADELSELKKNQNRTNEPSVQTVVQQVDFSALDEALADKIEKYSEQINLLAKNLELM